MSMNSCFKCGDIYDTDFQMEMIDDEMVCDRCYEDYCEKGRTDLTDNEKGVCPHCEGSGYADKQMTSTCAGCTGSGYE